MRHIRVAIVACVAGVLSLTTAGCAVLADAINPNILVQLGVDPNTIFPPNGTIIINFSNMTTMPAVFAAYQADSAPPFAADAVVQARNYARQVDAGEQVNFVLDCPVVAVSPGTIDDGLMIGTVAATVFTGNQGMDVNYDGAPLLSGRDFLCGDVIDVQLVQIANGGANAAGVFGIVVRVLPGR